jgi:hypothetical protein
MHNRLLNQSPSEFEHFVAEVWDSMGWDTQVTTASNDDGIDVIATKSGIHQEKAAIQAKKYAPSNKIGQPDIQQYDTLRRQDSSVDVVVVVTTSEFSKKAKELAERLNVKTVNGSAIANAALENLSDERLSDILEDENKSEEVDQTEPDQKANKNSTETQTLMGLSPDLEREDLNPVETKLAEIYEKNWQKRSKGSDGASLHFQFQETPEYLEIYQFYTGLHSIEFRNGEGAKLTSQKALEKSKSTSQIAKKYDWECSRSGKVVNINPNGDIEKNFNPEYEARFTNIVVSEFLGSSLNQIRLLTEEAHSSNMPTESYKLSDY